MKTQKTKTTTLTYLGYIQITGVPFSPIKGYENAIHAQTMIQCEKQAAMAIIETNRAIRGDEMKFIRKVLGMSRAELANKFGVNHQTIKNWEEARKQWVGPTNDAFFKLVVADKLGIHLSGAERIINVDQSQGALNIPCISQLRR